MDSLFTFKKKSSDVSIYNFRCNGWIFWTGATVTSVTVTVDPTGELLINSSIIDNPSQRIQCNISGGISGKKYIISIQMTNSRGEIKTAQVECQVY